MYTATIMLGHVRSIMAKHLKRVAPRLLLLLAAIAFRMVGFGLSGGAAVFALLLGSSLRCDISERSICLHNGISFLHKNSPLNMAGITLVPSCVHPLTLWPLMHDSQAHFFPSMTGIVYVAAIRPGSVLSACFWCVRVSSGQPVVQMDRGSGAGNRCRVGERV